MVYKTVTEKILHDVRMLDIDWWAWEGFISTTLASYSILISACKKAYLTLS